MIVKNGQKQKVLYDGNRRIYAIFHGYDLIYNCYAIPADEVLFIRSDGNADSDIKSNTSWNMELTE